MIFDFKKALRTALKNNQVFKGATDDHIRLIMDNGTQHKFKPDEFIVKEGQQVGNLYLIVDGQVEVKLYEKMPETGIKRFAEIKLNTLESGDCFGEYSIIDKQTVSASVKAVKQSMLFRISRIGFEKITGSNNLLAKIIYKNLLEILVRRLRKKDKELDNLLVII